MKLIDILRYCPRELGACMRRDSCQRAHSQLPVYRHVTTGTPLDEFRVMSLSAPIPLYTTNVRAWGRTPKSLYTVSHSSRRCHGAKKITLLNMIEESDAKDVSDVATQNVRASRRTRQHNNTSYSTEQFEEIVNHTSRKWCCGSIETPAEVLST
jgi:hypothetical protein